MLLVAYLIAELALYWDDKHGEDDSVKVVSPLNDGTQMVVLDIAADRSVLERRDKDGDRMWVTQLDTQLDDPFGLYAGLNGNHLFVKDKTVYLYWPGEPIAYYRFALDTGDSKGKITVPQGCKMPWFHTLVDSNTIYHPVSVADKCAILAVDMLSGKAKWTSNALEDAFFTPVQNDSFLVFSQARSSSHGLILVDKKHGKISFKPNYKYSVLRKDKIFAFRENISQVPAPVETTSKDTASPTGLPDATQTTPETQAVAGATLKKEYQFSILEQKDSTDSNDRVVVTWTPEQLSASAQMYGVGQPLVFWYQQEVLAWERGNKKTVLVARDASTGKKRWKMSIPKGYQPFFEYYSWVKSGSPMAYPYTDIPTRYVPFVLRQSGKGAFCNQSSFVRLKLVIVDMVAHKISYQSKPFVTKEFAFSELMDFHTFFANGNYYISLSIGNPSESTYHFRISGQTGKFGMPYRLQQKRARGWSPFRLVNAYQILPSLVKDGVHHLVHYEEDSTRVLSRIDSHRLTVTGSSDLQMIPMDAPLRQLFGLNNDILEVSDE